MPLLQRECYRFPRYVDDAAATLRAAMQNAGGRVAEDRFELINRVIVTLREQGIWVKLDCLYLFAAYDSASALINWKNPGTFDASYLATPPTFSANQGFTSTGGVNNTSINTNFNPVSASGKFARNSAHVGVWTLSPSGGSGNPTIGLMGPSDTYQTLLYPRNAGDPTAYFRCNTTSFAGTSGANTDATGFYISNRSGANNLEGYKNGSVLASTSADASEALISQNFYALGYDHNGTSEGSGYQQAMASIGGSLAATESAGYYAVLLTYRQAVGAV